MGNTSREPEHVQLEAARAVTALNSGVLSSLRNNATAYGYSITITAAFAIVSTKHPGTLTPGLILTFAAGAAAAFFLVELVSSRRFRRIVGEEEERVVFISGSIDMLSIITASAVAIPLAALPSAFSWVATAFGATLVYLLVGGIDMLIARALVRRRARGQ